MSGLSSALNLWLVEVAALEAEEQRLDELINHCTVQLRLLTDDERNSKLAYVTYHDIRNVESFTGNTVIAVKAPAETRLEVPDPKEVGVLYKVVTQAIAESQRALRRSCC